jgi:hypothetical protein
MARIGSTPDEAVDVIRRFMPGTSVEVLEEWSLLPRSLLFRCRVDEGPDVVVKYPLTKTRHRLSVVEASHEMVHRTLSCARVPIDVVALIGIAEDVGAIVTRFEPGEDIVELLAAAARADSDRAETRCDLAYVSRVSGAALGAVHRGLSPPGPLEFDLEPVRRRFRRPRAWAQLGAHVLLPVTSFHDYGPHNLRAGDDGAVWLLEPELAKSAEAAHDACARYVAALLWDVHRDAPWYSRRARRIAEENIHAFLDGYRAYGVFDPETPEDADMLRWLTAYAVSGLVLKCARSRTITGLRRAGRLFLWTLELALSRRWRRRLGLRDERR